MGLAPSDGRSPSPYRHPSLVGSRLLHMVVGEVWVEALYRQRAPWLVVSLPRTGQEFAELRRHGSGSGTPTAAAWISPREVVSLSTKHVAFVLCPPRQAFIILPKRSDEPGLGMWNMATVLVVDDERCMRMTLSLFLKADGHDVHVAASAQEAKTILAKTTVDVALLDVLLGRDSGLQLASFMRENYPQTQFSLMTGGPCLETASEATRLRAFSYLAKPLTRTQICDEVRRAAARKAAAESEGSQPV